MRELIHKDVVVGFSPSTLICMSDFVIPYRCVQQKWEWGALLADMDACLMRLIGYDSFCFFCFSVFEPNGNGATANCLRDC